ncbi:hypothetical protein AQUCO_04600005v1 [Aquilegia coerulea]|uniref:GST N-terminal domain-containing protein n=1 Tax=Aquilegia coerulea TaxID=218851 RepID=A0A2G5CL77_AQUCA|nr:hypothetical protein AQUCO_04600005v1 [Aquilegia coerulea]
MITDFPFENENSLEKKGKNKNENHFSKKANNMLRLGLGVVVQVRTATALIQSSSYKYKNINISSSSSSCCCCIKSTTTSANNNKSFFLIHPFSHRLLSFNKTKAQTQTTTSMATGVQELLPPVLNSASDPPSLFDGTSRLYISYICPYAQRAWIARNCKGLQDKIELVAIDLNDRPAWYKEKLYPANKVPALEHNNEVKGESLDLIKYLNSQFEGPALLPDDPAKLEFAEELFSYTDTFNGGVITAIKGNGDVDAPFDYLEKTLSKFEDGPFFLGQFSLVDIAYAPFIQRYHPLLLDVKKYDVTTGRPKLTSWIEVR